MSIQKVSSFQDEGGKLKAVASGTLPNGKPVVVNSDGTVSVVEESSGTEAVGTPVEFEAGNTVFGPRSLAYDSANGKVVIAFRDAGNSSYGTAIVGTVSGSSITFGTAVVFSSGVTVSPSICYDENSGKMVIAYEDGGNSDAGTAIVGTVSGTSISFGTAVVFDTLRSDTPFAVYDSVNNKTVILYEQNQAYGRGVVGTVSGTSISFGSPVGFNVGITDVISAAFSTSAGKILVTYANGASGYRGECRVCTVSGTSMTVGNADIFDSSSINRSNTGTVYDPITDKFVISYSDTGSTDDAKGVVATVSGTSTTYGTAVTWSTGKTQWNTAVYHVAAQKVILLCEDEGDSGKIKYSVATINGTGLTTTTAANLTTTGATYICPTYDSGNNIAVVGYRLDSALRGYAQTLQLDYTLANLTANNYIGISTGGAVADTGSATVDIIGSMNDAQTGLTAGQAYYVQTDGTLSTTAGDPSVFAGTAINGTTILVKS